MILQDAIKAMMKLPLEVAAESIVTRPDGCSSRIKIGFDPLNCVAPYMVVYDAEEPAKFMQDHCAWVCLRLDEILADDWEIVKDND